jgi:hypothetical protein
MGRTRICCESVVEIVSLYLHAPVDKIWNKQMGDCKIHGQQNTLVGSQRFTGDPRSVHHCSKSDVLESE